MNHIEELQKAFENELYETSDNGNTFIEVTELTEYNLKFTCYETTSWTQEGQVSSFDELLTGYIKWDGCTHWWVSDNDGYLHICGSENLTMINETLVNIWKYAQDKIVKFQDEERL